MIPITPLLVAYLAVFLISWLLNFVLTKMNDSHLKTHGHRIPNALVGYVDHDKLSNITGYTADNHRFAIVRSLIGGNCFVAAVLFGLFPWFFEVVKNNNIAGRPFRLKIR